MHGNCFSLINKSTNQQLMSFRLFLIYFISYQLMLTSCVINETTMMMFSGFYLNQPGETFTAAKTSILDAFKIPIFVSNSGDNNNFLNQTYYPNNPDQAGPQLLTVFQIFRSQINEIILPTDLEAYYELYDEIKLNNYNIKITSIILFEIDHDVLQYPFAFETKTNNIIYTQDIRRQNIPIILYPSFYIHSNNSDNDIRVSVKNMFPNGEIMDSSMVFLHDLPNSWMVNFKIGYDNLQNIYNDVGNANEYEIIMNEKLPNGFRLYGMNAVCPNDTIFAQWKLYKSIANQANIWITCILSIMISLLYEIN
eukprot:438082_1